MQVKELLSDLQFQRKTHSVFRPRALLELSLTGCTFTETKRGRQHHVTWQDVLGAHVLTAQGVRIPASDSAAMAILSFAQTVDAMALGTSNKMKLVLVALPPKNKQPDKPKKRALQRWTCEFSASRWTEVEVLFTRINYLADPRSRDLIKQATSLDDIHPVKRSPRKFLVVVNPVSGAGKSERIYAKHIAPIFEFANIETEVRRSARPNHTKEIAMGVSLDEYNAIVVVGGDGSLCEVFQGLMQRNNWQEAIRLPIGVIPSGSGNGLFASTLYKIGEAFEPANAAFVASQGVPYPLDLTAVQNPFGEIMYSFLSNSWAFLADLDVDSEKYRFLGVLRFTIAALNHIFFIRRRYHGAIWYLEDDANMRHKSEQSTLDPNGGRLECPLVQNLEDGALASDNSGARWRKLEGPFHMAFTSGSSHIATDTHIAPGSGLNDGYTYFVVLDADRPRMDLLKILLSCNDGSHVDLESLRFIRTRAFKIDPLQQQDRICVDGELFRGPIEGQVHRGIARVLTLPL